MFSKRYFLILIIITALSCSKFSDFGNINQNPGATTEPIPSALLTNVLATLGNDTWDAAFTGSAGLTTVSGLYCQYFSETQYTELSTYAKTNINWDNYYLGKLYDLQTIINYNSDQATSAKAAIYGSNNNQIAIARILKVYLFSLLTDSYGDLPYFGALKADNGIVIFDAQELIYNDFFKELSEVVEQFDNGNAVLGDILFNGDVIMWRKFANSLHALLALHLSQVNPAMASSEFNAALYAQDGVFEFNENAQLNYPGVNYYNPVYVYYVSALQLRLAVSQTMTDWLLGRNDNRINAYGTASLGFPYGLTRDSALSFSNANPGWARILQGENTSSSAPFPILTSAEVFLARAEAAQRKWTTEDAATLYKNGIAESWKYWGVYDDVAFNSYILQSYISLTDNDALQKICEQEWTAHYPNGPRGWTVWRRTGYPNLIPAIGSISNKIPTRFSYGNNEYSTNTENVSNAAAQYNVNGETDSQYGIIWWDTP